MENEEKVHQLIANLSHKFTHPVQKITGVDFKEIKQFYSDNYSLIYNEEKKFIRTHWFFLKLQDWMTPIERNVFWAIKRFNLPFYLQLPILKYFLDFADPWRMVCIEADGKDFHQDFDKDYDRDKNLEALGWTVYRIKGENTFEPEKLYSFFYPIIEKHYPEIING